MAVADSGHRKTGGNDELGSPFGYYLERDPGLLLLRRADGSDVAAFGAGGLCLFEVESAVWEDADGRPVAHPWVP